MAHRVLVAGETLIDMLPDRPGSLADVGAFERRAGGAPANVAVALARLDETPLLWTRLAADPFGDFLAERLASEGLPDRFVERDPDARTALAFVAHDDDADRRFTFYRDGTADTRIRPGTVPDAVLDDLDWVHVGGVALTDEPARSATLDLAERARDAGCTVSFDPNARPELWDGTAEYAAAVNEALAYAHVVKTDPDELAFLDVDAPEELARAVRKRGPHTVFVTLGDDGALASSGANAPWSGETRHSGFEVVSVDTTGAGDAFLAGAITAMLDERNRDETLAFANAVAATATTEAGAMEALPEREAAERMLERT